MSDQVNVHTISALEDVRGAIITFANRSAIVLAAADGEIQGTLDWLAGRRAFWLKEVERWEREFKRAQGALASCQVIAAASDGYVSCAAEEAAVVRARRALDEAVGEARKTTYWLGRVHAAAGNYRGTAKQLGDILHDRLPQGVALLAADVQHLEGYKGVSAQAGGAPPTSMVTPTSMLLPDEYITPGAITGQPETSGGLEVQSGPEHPTGGPERRG